MCRGNPSVKILHLSDLHLGKRVYECSMLEEQRVILEQALAMAAGADLTVIAGDIYDRQVPPAEAVAVFDDFLTRMSAQGSPVALIYGNHDSAERIAFGAQLLGGSGIYVSPVYDGAARRIELEDEYGPVHVHLLPFVKPAHVRAALGDMQIEGYTDAVASAIGAMQIDPSARNVLVAHQFVAGAQRSESEEVSVGGLDCVDAGVFAPFDYVALGHLHAQQSLMDGRVRYCGAPLHYAFSECSAGKCALMAELGEKGVLHVERLAFEPVRRMRTLRGTFDALCDVKQTSNDYLQIVLTDEGDVPDAARKLSAVYPNLLQVIYDNARTRALSADFSAGAQEERSPVELFEQLFVMQNGEEMTAAERACLTGMMEKIWEDDA